MDSTESTTQTVSGTAHTIITIFRISNPHQWSLWPWSRLIDLAKTVVTDPRGGRQGDRPCMGDTAA
jgi:hypothetical protein